MSAVLSRSIHSRLANEARTLQPTHIIMTTPQIALIPQPTEPVVGKLNDHPPSDTQSNFTAIPPSSEAAGQPSPAGDDVQDPSCEQKSCVNPQATVDLPADT